MDKKTYYVSVQAATVLQNPEAADFEFEIVATERDVEQLMELFNEHNDYDTGAFIHSMTPDQPYHDDVENDGYDVTLLEIYRRLYELGTSKTKHHIKRMGVLDREPRTAVHQGMPLLPERESREIAPD